MTAHYVTLRSTEEQRQFSIRCNRLAKTQPQAGTDWGGELYFVSGAGTSTAIKALAATLNSRRPLGLFVDGLRPPKHGQPPVSLYVATTGLGYTVLRQRLGLDQWHLMAWTKDWKFMPQDTDQHLWAILKSENYTTPLLRAWMPYIRGRLKSRGYLKELECHRATCLMLYAPPVKLDEIVSEGVAAGELKLEEA